MCVHTAFYCVYLCRGSSSTQIPEAPADATRTSQVSFPPQPCPSLQDATDVLMLPAVTRAALLAQVQAGGKVVDVEAAFRGSFDPRNSGPDADAIAATTLKVIIIGVDTKTGMWQASARQAWPCSFATCPGRVCRRHPEGWHHRRGHQDWHVAGKCPPGVAMPSPAGIRAPLPQSGSHQPWPVTQPRQRVWCSRPLLACRAAWSQRARRPAKCCSPTVSARTCPALAPQHSLRRSTACSSTESHPPPTHHHRACWALLLLTTAPST